MYGLPEDVLVENEWYDGPRAGVAIINGQPHRFKFEWDEKEDDYLSTFWIWPIDTDEVALEQEQWSIFVAWNERYEAGEVDTSTHPGHVGMNERWDEITSMLSINRHTVPHNAKRAKAKMVSVDREKRYAVSGPDYQLCWEIL